MQTLQALMFCAGLVGAAAYDVKTRLVDDRVCIFIALAGLVTISHASFLGALMAALPFFIGSGTGKNGAGDVYLSAATGFVLGPSRTLAGLALFLVLYALYISAGGLLAWLQHKPLPKSCPLVPFIAAGFIPAYFFA